MSDTVPLGLADITCPACEGKGKRFVDSGQALTEYTCESCRGLGLVHPIVAQRIKERMAKSGVKP